ncbi:hypothetical protein KY363_07860, partial [Candidatus Woesearchaeota archaeon]|nr:hypothetical protein [Candidatus Woesearchaeota archaeon]
DSSGGSGLSAVAESVPGASLGYDFLKFNFPVCGNLSSADLMVIYAALNGFNVFVVGNAERMLRDAVIVKTLGLRNVQSIPELPFDARADPERAASMLSFTNTQHRGYAAIPPNGLVLEMAADQPLLYNTFRHAIDLSRPAHLAINLNAVTLMKEQVPTFTRNGYDKVVNSEGQEVVIKENNNFAQTKLSAEANAPVFSTIYERRNGGRYLTATGLIKRLGPRAFLQKLVRIIKAVPHIPHLASYIKQRRTLKRAASYESLNAFMNAMLSPYWLKDAVHVDATNDDIFSCWDMDGLNNDYLGYKAIFQRNFNNLGAIMPYAEEAYKVHEAMGKAGLGEQAFNRHYESLRHRLLLMMGQDQLHSLGIEEDVAGRVRQVCSAVFDGSPNGSLEGIEQHAKTAYRERFEQSREEYAKRRRDRGPYR